MTVDPTQTQLDHSPRYRSREVVRPSSGTRQHVVHGPDGLHEEATAWLQFLDVTGKSRDTLRAYASRLAWYLSWCDGEGRSWREPSLTHLAEFKRALAESPYRSGSQWRRREPKTVELWLTAITQFYQWAAVAGHVPRDMVDSFFVNKWIPAGRHGTEHGRTVTVKAGALSVAGRRSAAPPEWLEGAEERKRLRSLSLNTRDRFLLDLLDCTGIRIGEALSLWREDVHFMSVNASVGCRVRGPHLHVRPRATTDNPAATKDRRGRVVPVAADLAQAHWAYVSQRHRTLGVDDSPYLFVNLYSSADRLGQVMSIYSVNEVFKRVSAHLGRRVTPHMLRHTRATLWVRGIEGPAVPLDVAQALLGHVSLDSTRVYLHGQADAMRRAVDELSVEERHGTVGRSL